MCNISINYSNTPLLLQGILDFVGVGACLFLGCNADPYSHTISGPTPDQYYGNAFVPVADVIFPAENLPRLLYTSADEIANIRTTEFQTALGDRSRSVTMATAVVEDTQGTRRLVISSSEPNGYIRKEVRDLILPDEIVVPVKGHNHAEINIINWAEENGLKLINMSAGNHFCPRCRPVLEDIFTVVSKKLAKK